VVWCILWVVVVVGGGTRGNILLFFVHGKSPSRSLSARPRSLFAPGRVTASHYRSLLSRETAGLGLCAAAPAPSTGDEICRAPHAPHSGRTGEAKARAGGQATLMMAAGARVPTSDCTAEAACPRAPQCERPGLLPRASLRHGRDTPGRSACRRTRHIRTGVYNV
jgi:hypothetical protein